MRSDRKRSGLLGRGLRMKNVQITEDLFHRIRGLLDYIDIRNYDIVVQDEYRYIVDELDNKIRKMELRESYKAVITAEDEDSRDFARINYLKDKSQIPNT